MFDLPLRSAARWTETGGVASHLAHKTYRGGSATSFTTAMGPLAADLRSDGIHILARRSEPRAVDVCHCSLLARGIWGIRQRTSGADRSLAGFDAAGGWRNSPPLSAVGFSTTTSHPTPAVRPGGSARCWHSSTTRFQLVDHPDVVRCRALSELKGI